mgnify:CR=1 FL=1
MVQSDLDPNKKKSIIFDLIDGIPASEDLTPQEVEFRKEIESDNYKLEALAEELGIHDALFEFSSQGKG